jgi:uncharacterized protein (UPF0212 family)
MSVVADHAAPTAVSGSTCELAEIFARYGGDYARNHPLRKNQRKALRAIIRCRTAALGGHREWCDSCGFERYVYHSCRNRHCPKCQSTAKAAWVAARQQELLPVPYFHNVFTLPHELNRLILWTERNQRALLKLLFDAAAHTLLEFGRRDLGGQLGVTLVLHTWDQQLRAHFHVHALIPSGALSADGSHWIAGGRQFLFPVCGLSKMFRGKYLDGLSQLLERGELDLPPQWAALGQAESRHRYLRQWRKKPWVVYSQRPFAGPRKLLDYLGRYTHRVAISNQRLLSCEEGQVLFRYRDRRDGDRCKSAAVPAEEFIGRFLQHVLPDRFARIRHYGLLANRGKHQRLAHCRQLLGTRLWVSEEASPRNAAEWLKRLLDIDITRCPCCGAELQREPLLPERIPVDLRLRPIEAEATSTVLVWDTS